MRFIILTVFTLISILPTARSAYISGKILNAPPQYGFLLIRPIGCYYNGEERIFTDSIQPDKSGSFSILLNKINCYPVYITLQSKEFFINLFIQQKDSLEITIDLPRAGGQLTAPWLQIKGPNSQGQLFFNEYDYSPAEKFKPVYKYFDTCADQPPTQLARRVAAFAERQLYWLDSLFLKGRIDSQFYRYVKADIQSVLIDVAIDEYKKKYKDKALIFEGAMYQLISPMDSLLLHGKWGGVYAMTYLKYLDRLPEIGQRQGDSFSDPPSAFKFLRHSKDLRFLDALWGRLLLTVFFMAEAEIAPANEIQQEMKSFVNYFPNSSYTPVINKMRLRLGMLNMKKNLMPDSTVHTLTWKLDTSFTVKSWKELVASVKDSTALITIWASWCKPCLEHFEALDKLYAWKNKAAERTLLFISIDKPITMELAEKTIGRFDMQGRQLLAGLLLRKDLARLFGERDGLDIPLYLLLNKGTISRVEDYEGLK